MDNRGEDLCLLCEACIVSKSSHGLTRTSDRRRSWGSIMVEQICDRGLKACRGW